MALSLPRVVSIAGLCVAVACATAPAPSPSASTFLTGTDGRGRSFPELSRQAPLTVLVFFSAHCPCTRAHDQRLRALAERFASQGVRFFAVDSEYGATLERDRTEASQRGYPFPLLIDPGARLAEAVGARYATFTVVFDATGAIRYRGGLDSDQSVLHADAQVWLAKALEELLAGQAVTEPETKALGCALQRW